jgi:peptidoglycan endopeptidase LytE
MKTWLHTLTISCAVVGAALFVGGHNEAHAATDSEVKVQVNDDLVNFTTAQPIMKEDTLYVPIRPLAEKAGYGLDWHEDKDGQIVVTFSHEGKSVTLKTGEASALVNGKTVQLHQIPFTQAGSTYVPFRFVGESFGHILQWDDKNEIAILGEDGKYHAPAWYKPAKVESTASKIIETAKKYLGTRYVYGGESPNGFDCSGFVQYVYRQYGIELPRSAADMYTAGTKVSNPEPGDLVFFKAGSKVSHVGIYIGDGTYIDAASGSRMKVTYTSLSSTWSSKYYVGAKRVL